MNHLVTALIVLYAAAYCEATLFSWGGSSAESKEIKPNGYLPLLKIHKYNGIQIHPIQGAPIYLPNEPTDSNNLEGQTTPLSPDQIQQLDLINRLATFLPSEDNLQEMDLTAALPYVDLITEESLENFKNTLEAVKPKEKSKLLKFIGFLKHIKEKKLKPFKYVASLGSKIVHKKKSWLGLGAASTPPLEPITELPPVSYPPYNFAYNPYLVAQKPAPSPAPLPSYSYYHQYPIYSYNMQQKNTAEKTASLPSADIFPPSYLSITQPKQSIEIPSEPLTSPRPTPHFQQFPQSFQFPSDYPSTQYQQPAQIQYQFQYPSLPEPAADPAKNDVRYEYKQTPASTYSLTDPNAIRQFASSNQSELPSIPAPKTEQSYEQQYSYQSNQIPSFGTPQQTLAVPKYQSNSYYVASYSNQDSNKFYTTSPNDLAAAGSENVEKIEQQVKPESNLKQDPESIKVENSVTSSTETSALKSQHVSPKRTVLRAVGAPTRANVHPVYPSLPKEENLKDDGNKSSTVSAEPPTTN